MVQEEALAYDQVKVAEVLYGMETGVALILAVAAEGGPPPPVLQVAEATSQAVPVAQLAVATL